MELYDDALIELESDYIMHYGTKRHSGRYPWGSGDVPYQHEKWFRWGGGNDQHSYDSRDKFLAEINRLRKEGLSDTEIAKEFGLSTTNFRTQYSLAKDERRYDMVKKANELRDQGLSLKQIADEMGFENDSSVRSLLNQEAAMRMNESRNAAAWLKTQVGEKGMLDVGKGVERELNISEEKMNQALYLLELDGYKVYKARVAQATNPGQYTEMQILCPPGTAYKDVYADNFKNIHTVTDYISHDNGQTFDPKFVRPTSLDSSRVQVRYAEDGGLYKDGIIEIRRGVDDLSLGESHYAQVRILVDDTHYLKGMAVYSDAEDWPEGVDIIFNTNKNSDVPMLGPKDNTVLKIAKNDPRNPDNPFGSSIKEGIYDPLSGETSYGYGQSYYIDKDGNRQLSAINKRSDEGDWSKWADKLPSQFLSKQSTELAKKQLYLSEADKQAELEEILNYTNPTIKKELLLDFANSCDKAALTLAASALPGQKYKVILPVNSLSEKEVYAPTYKDGEQLALVRFPHGGTFEIPIVTVNNKNQEGQNILNGLSEDAIGINYQVASRLSGADFDGDTVLAIPLRNGVKINSTSPLKGLEGFDPSVEYPYYEGMKVMSEAHKQREMGIISNLITDMTLDGGASEDELARAVRHSMVVIDAPKHRYDYKKSEVDNGIQELKEKYQRHVDEDGNVHYGGSSTIISKAKSEERVPLRKGSAKIDEEGNVYYNVQPDDKRYYIDKKTGKQVERTTKSTKMAETKDAHTLSSGTPMEELYADYANKMKALAQEARKEYRSTPRLEYSPSAAKLYSEEVESLNAKLAVAQANAPRERAAQRQAYATVQEDIAENGPMTTKEKTKAGTLAITKARQDLGSSRKTTTIVITDKEWEAIQAGAITDNQLKIILQNTDKDALKQRAMPKASSTLSAAKINRINAMKNSGYTIAEIADAVGVSSTTVSKYLKGE